MHNMITGHGYSITQAFFQYSYYQVVILVWPRALFGVKIRIKHF